MLNLRNWTGCMEPPEFELCKLHQCWRKGKKCKQKCGKRQQELAVDVSHRASWDEAWRRYASGVFHNWSKEARGLAGSRSVCSGFVPGRSGRSPPKCATVNLATSAPDPITAPAPAICRYISDDSERCLAITGIVDPCPAPMGLPAGTGNTVSLGGTASHHSGFACFFTTSTPFSHLAST